MAPACAAKGPERDSARSPSMLARMRGVPAHTRSRRSPAPGHAPGKAENRRCKVLTTFRVGKRARVQNPRNGVANATLSRYLELDNATLETEGDRVGSVVGAELREDTADVTLDGLFGDVKFIRD